MQIKKLDHVNLRTTRMPEMIAWYESVLGLENGQRPDFGFPGAWMYAGAHAFVHLVHIDGTESMGSENELKLEHFAFIASGSSEFEALLKNRDEKYRRVENAGTGLVAFNVWDPDGNHIHVDFPTTE